MNRQTKKSELNDNAVLQYANEHNGEKVKYIINITTFLVIKFYDIISVEIKWSN